LNYLAELDKILEGKPLLSEEIITPTNNETIETDRLIIIKSFSSPLREMYEIKDKGNDTPDWLRGSMYPRHVGDLTIDFLPNNEAHFNWINMSGGKGFATETIKAILKNLKERGITKAKTYIESSNYAPQKIARKLGFKEAEIQKQGSYWTLDF